VAAAARLTLDPATPAADLAVDGLLLASNNTGILGPVVLEAALGRAHAPLGMLATVVLYFQQLPTAQLLFRLSAKRGRSGTATAGAVASSTAASAAAAVAAAASLQQGGRTHLGAECEQERQALLVKSSGCSTSANDAGGRNLQQQQQQQQHVVHVLETDGGAIKQHTHRFSSGNDNSTGVHDAERNSSSNGERLTGELRDGGGLDIATYAVSLLLQVSAAQLMCIQLLPACLSDCLSDCLTACHLLLLPCCHARTRWCGALRHLLHCPVWDRQPCWTHAAHQHCSRWHFLSVAWHGLARPLLR
jgi:hypothetical protein